MEKKWSSIRGLILAREAFSRPNEYESETEAVLLRVIFLVRPPFSKRIVDLCSMYWMSISPLPCLYLFWKFREQKQERSEFREEPLNVKEKWQARERKGEEKHSLWVCLEVSFVRWTTVDKTSSPSEVSLEILVRSLWGRFDSTDWNHDRWSTGRSVTVDVVGRTSLVVGIVWLWSDVLFVVVVSNIFPVSIHSSVHHRWSTSIGTVLSNVVRDIDVERSSTSNAEEQLDTLNHCPYHWPILLIHSFRERWRKRRRSLTEGFRSIGKWFENELFVIGQRSEETFRRHRRRLGKESEILTSLERGEIIHRSRWTTFQGQRRETRRRTIQRRQGQTQLWTSSL